MKKGLLSAVLLILLPFSIAASTLAYSPYLNLAAGGNAARLENEDFFRSQASLEAVMGLLGMRVGRHQLALPVTLCYHTESPKVNQLFLTESLDIGVGIRYGYSPMQGYRFLLGADFSYRYYTRMNAGLLLLSLVEENFFDISPVLSILLPLKLSLTKGELDFSLSLGISLRYDF